MVSRTDGGIASLADRSDVSSAGRPYSLDLQDETRRAAGRYRVSVWPETGEAAVTWIGAPRVGHPREDEGKESPDTEPDARADRRARAQLKRYSVRNDIRRLWTLTCADQTPDETLMRQRVAKFERRLRAEFGPLPYVRVLERHRSGALHAHFGLPARFLDHARVSALWGHGFVHYRDRRRRRISASGRVTGRRYEARALAGYLAKYLAKDPVRGDDGGHRYEVAEGFQPTVVRRSFGSLGASLEHIRERFELAAGEHLDWMWDSSTFPDWTGPPVRYLRYEEAA